jgi:hypothetical protein
MNMKPLKTLTLQTKEGRVMNRSILPAEPAKAPGLLGTLRKRMDLIWSASLALSLMLWAEPDARAGTNSLQIQTNPAVEVKWPGTNSALYQVYTSTNMVQWTPYGQPVAGVGGSNISVAYPLGNVNAAFFMVDQLPGFLGLTNLELGAASVTVGSNGFGLSNLRVGSASTTLNDYISANFTFDMTYQVFRLTNYTVSPGVGVYNPPFFANNNTNAIYLYQTTNNLLNSDTEYYITTQGNAYYMDLTVGQTLSFLQQNSTVSYQFEFIDPNTNVLDNGIYSAGEGVITAMLPITTPGRYLVKFTPYNTSATNVSLDVTFLNANGRLLTTISNGSAISLNFANNLRDYAKFQVTLNTNQLLTLPVPSDSNVAFKILNSASANVLNLVGLPVNFQPQTADTYYLFIYNQNGWGSSYSGTVGISTVTNAPAIVSPLAKPNSIK